MRVWLWMPLDLYEERQDTLPSPMVVLSRFTARINPDDGCQQSTEGMSLYNGIPNGLPLCKILFNINVPEEILL
jgi:hypothetical protein